ncbi:MAG: transglycosylase domain-containing protein [Erysipelotrichaceae bacterium]|nr:transglycosylase domain-containing protein [Erysipelotrichaceae bacterium]
MKNNDEELNPTAARKAARRKIMAEKRAAAKEKAVESTGENYTEVPKEETRENVSLKDRLKNTFASKKEDGEAKEVKDGEEKISLKERFARFTASLTPKKEKETGPLIIEAENMETAPETEETVKEETVSSTAAENLIIEEKIRAEKKKEKKAKTEKEKIERPATSRKVKIWAIVVSVIAVIGIIGVIGAAIFGFTLIKDKPEFDAAKLASEDSTIIYDANGNEIVELGLYLRENIDYESMPNCLIDAFMSIEDSRYFQHFGFDIPRFTKAIIENLKSGDFGQGGSTITMQLVKNSYFQIDAGGESTMAAASGMSGVKRKAQEIILAIECNFALSKEETIALYINKINFGNNIRGVQKAAEYYFGKDADQLNLVESCFLAGIINSPNNYNPYNELYKNNPSYIYLNPDITYLENAQERTAEVLDLMVHHGYLTKEEAALAKTVKIENILAGADKKFKSYSEYYQDYIDAVIDEAEKVTGKDPYSTSMKIYTNMDPYMQKLVWDIENEKTDLYYTRDLEQSAIVVLNNQTGELVALGGGRNQEKEVRQFNRATSAYLQPGSSIKPVLEYVLAFDRLGWSTAHTITDKPYYLYDGNILVANAGGQGYTGDMLITEAIARSLNTPAVQTFDAVIKEIGEDGVKDYLRSIGITANLDTMDLQWAIGGNTCIVTPVQLAGAHSVFMNNGRYVTPHTIRSIEFADDSKYEADTQGKQVVSPAAAYMAAVCEEYNVSGPFFNLMQILQRDYPVYAKTGTTDWSTSGLAYGIPTGAPKDMWMVAQTSNYTVTVWLGFDRAEPGAFFTSAEDMANLKGRICRLLLNELDTHFDYGPHAVERPDDVTDVTIVKGAYPYCYPNGGYETVTGLIRADMLEKHPLVDVSEVLANLPVKDNDGGTIHLSGYVDEYGTAKITVTSGGYYCSGGTQDLTAKNIYGKTKEATGRCYFPHYASTGSQGSASAYLVLKVNGEYYSDGEADGYYEFYGVPEGNVQVCAGENCVSLNRVEYSGE